MVEEVCIWPVDAALLAAGGLSGGSSYWFACALLPPAGSPSLDCCFPLRFDRLKNLDPAWPEADRSRVRVCGGGGGKAGEFGT